MPAGVEVCEDWNEHMAIEVRIDWTPNQWRRFFGRPDTTPLVELMSVMIDKMALLDIDRRLEALTSELEDIETGTGPTAPDAAAERGV